MSLNRRSFLKILSATMITTIGASSLVACTNTPSTQTTGDGATRIVKDIEDNDVEVPATPERIVTLSEPTLDGVLALGLTPIGAVAGRGQQDIPNYLKEAGHDIPIFGSVAQPNFEVIGAAKPDLILVDGTSVNNNPPVLEALRAIAPVVYTGYAGGDWKDNLRLTADAVNKKEEGEKIIANYAKHAEEVSKKLGDYKDSTFSVVRWQGTNGSLILNELPAGRALLDVGLKRPASQDRRGRGHSEPVSLENLKDLDADYMFFGTLGGSSVSNQQAGGDADHEAAVKAIEQAKKLPGFTDLVAFQSQHIIPVDGSVWTSTGGPLLMHRIIDDIEKNLV
ncbi:iron-siderophore ABC transporter substrate-binding protein [Corynebacterium felinum]|uniref:Iron complex transport system substrate-binding protein n=1 Tax=Corynebacterium felinum TaxID=131318 RepID=A0ABU2B6C5_9CORY|nr:iron-siderophore ABC transporter substrate-binding protein [Corynebacterium felinum]MDF5820788.1 iron-siderophore ABC transporter substrate-binding protein [Corynebacterium felinum]MDR7353831.1 iron complex transport system substrate-binding protein [Corynebacterium felinum]WJY96007.1 putative siderophore-binding lipoprotein YfiY precursor [Corynebacterium felinum]